MTRVQVGDVVHVRATVVEIATTDAIHPVKVQFSDRYDAPDWAWIHASEVVKVEERPLQAGDRVRNNDFKDGGDGVILAIDGEWAWVRRYAPGEVYSHYVAPLTDLERIP